MVGILSQSGYGGGMKLGERTLGGGVNGKVNGNAMGVGALYD